MAGDIIAADTAAAGVAAAVGKEVGMCHYYFGFGDFRGFGIFHGFGGILGIALTILAILFAVKLVKDIVSRQR